MNYFSRKTLFLTLILLIGAAGLIYAGVRIMKPTLIPTVRTEASQKPFEVPSDTKGYATSTESTMYGIPLEKPDPTLKSSFSEENFPGWKLLWKHTLTTTTPDYPGLQNVQQIGLRHGSDGTFGTIKEYFIANADTFQNYLKEHAVPGENAQLPYWYVSIQGKDRRSGVMVVGKNHAALIEQGFPWSLFPEKELDDLISYSNANANGELVVATTSTIPSLTYISKSILSKNLMDSFHLRINSNLTGAQISDEYSNLHQIQTAGITTSNGNSFFMDEFTIKDRKALLGSLGMPVLKVGERYLYSGYTAGMVSYAGLFLIGEEKALLLYLPDNDWDFNTDPDIINFLKNVPLP